VRTSATTTSSTRSTEAFARRSATPPAPTTEKGKLFDLLGARAVGIDLTESFAMTPAASVSGIYLAHPASRYFNIGRIGRDQVEDYARRKGVPVLEVERWLAPNLGYDRGN
jgi:5-methyltetrahydrofolate--homocysteine methyltransferase